MVSGAGRMLTRRSPTALRCRFTQLAASRRCAMIAAAWAVCWSPIDPSRGPSSRSTAARSPTDRQAVSRTSRVARHSLIVPERKACRVCGISRVSARASPTCRFPRNGESRRANAISAPMLRWAPSFFSSVWVSPAVRDATNAAVRAAWAAAHADLIRSSSVIWSISSGSSAPVFTARSRVTQVASSAADSAVSVSLSPLPAPCDSNMCTSLYRRSRQGNGRREHPSAEGTAREKCCSFPGRRGACGRGAGLAHAPGAWDR